MTQQRSTTILVICIFEAFVGLYGLVSQALATLSMYLVAHRYHYGAIQSGMVIATALCIAMLSFAIAVFVWNSLRTAFVLSLIKLLLGAFSTLSVFYIVFKRGMITNPYLLHSPAFLISFWVPRLIGGITLLLSLVITIYLYRIAFAKEAMESTFGYGVTPPADRP